MIKIHKLTKTFYPNTARAFVALDAIDLHIKANELIILKGVSGSGKSTLLSLIAALQKPTSGEIIVADEAIAKLPDLHASHFRAAKIGFVPQAFHLFENLTVLENLSLALIPLGFTPKEISQKSQKALELAAISHKANEIVNNLSGGEKQRSAIARALVNDAEIILCDEPTANLDKQNAQKFITILKTLKVLGKTIIIATHDPIFESLDFCDRSIQMQDGKIR